MRRRTQRTAVSIPFRPADFEKAPGGTPFTCETFVALTLTPELLATPPKLSEFFRRLRARSRSRTRMRSGRSSGLRGRKLLREWRRLRLPPASPGKILQPASEAH